MLKHYSIRVHYTRPSLGSNIELNSPFHIALAHRQASPLCNIRRSCALRGPLLTNRANSLRRCNAHDRAGSWRRSLHNATGWPHTDRDIGIASALLALNDNIRVA